MGTLFLQDAKSGDSVNERVHTSTIREESKPIEIIFTSDGIQGGFHRMVEDSRSPNGPHEIFGLYVKISMNICGRKTTQL